MVFCSHEIKLIILLFVVVTIGTAVLSYRQTAEKLVRLQQKKKSKKQRHQRMVTNLKET